MDSSFAYLFRGLEDGQMKKIMAIGKEIPIKKGQQIFREGQNANGVYLLREGSVELMTLVDGDFELPISILRNPGDVLGTSALVPLVNTVSRLVAWKRALSFAWRRQRSEDWQRKTGTLVVRS